MAIVSDDEFFILFSGERRAHLAGSSGPSSRPPVAQRSRGGPSDRTTERRPRGLRARDQRQKEGGGARDQSFRLANESTVCATSRTSFPYASICSIEASTMAWNT